MQRIQSLSLGLASLFALSACSQGATTAGNSATAQAASGQPVINEVYYDTPGTDTGTFIELKGAAGKSLSGYKLVAYNTSGSSYATITLTGSIPASGYYVVGQDSTVASNQQDPGTDLYNTKGSLRLFQGSTLIDALAYGGPSSNLGEGASAPAAATGSALARVPDGTDTGNNSADFKAQAPTPGAANSSGGGSGSAKKVLFDLTKHEDAGNSDWRIDGAYSSYGDALRALGYSVSTLTGSGVTAASLSGVSVLVIPEPQNPFSDTERTAILNFVKAGGGLFLISDHRDSDRDNDGWDSPEVIDGWDRSTPASVSASLQKSLDAQASFGMSASFGSSFNDPVYTVTPTGVSSPILTGVNSAGIYVGTSIDGGTGLMAYGGKNYLAETSLGSGRVVLWGDSSTFEDNTLSDGSTGQYNNWTALDNATLGKNVVRWLAHDL